MTVPSNNARAGFAIVLLDTELRGRMERLGIQRAAHFSWQKTAQKTLEAFHQVVEQPRAAVRRLASQMMTHR